MHYLHRRQGIDSPVSDRLGNRDWEDMTLWVMGQGANQRSQQLGILISNDTTTSVQIFRPEAAALENATASLVSLTELEVGSGRTNNKDVPNDSKAGDPSPALLSRLETASGSGHPYAFCL